MDKRQIIGADQNDADAFFRRAEQIAWLARMIAGKLETLGASLNADELTRLADDVGCLANAAFHLGFEAKRLAGQGVAK